MVKHKPADMHEYVGQPNNGDKVLKVLLYEQIMVVTKLTAMMLRV